MRKLEQRQILDDLRTFDSAHKELPKMSGDGAVQLLENMQLLAQDIGERIEATEGEGTRTVALLEEYCDLVFALASGNEGASVNKLKQQYVKIINSVRGELKPNKVEVAFLAYNASMSDSIWSIYQAAKDDPSCDAYWIPIPYYERRPDGSFGEIRFEGPESYPDIECTDWRTYSIEARRPDVIFSYNPYDGNNLVTSVHPDFYFERLRQFTDLLCYVPYFVNGNNPIAEHFCTLPGCVFADRVFLESDAVRDSYVRVFKEQFGNRFGSPKEKFVALGSPKFDKVLMTKREDCDIPAEWRELIGNRKVVLYNTSVGAMLANNEQYLKKLRSVFDTFSKRDDVVLWWRPHPLSMATFESMRPELAKEYREIVDEYKSAGWGIYDDGTDFVAPEKMIQ